VSLARFAKRRDANEPEIVQALQRCGCLVFSIDRPADLAIWYRGKWTLAECKNLKGRGRRLTPSQRADHALLPAGSIPIIESVDDALALVARMGK